MTKFSQKIHFHVTVDSAEWLGYILYGLKFIWQGDREHEKTSGFAVCTRAVRLYADWRRSRRCRIANAAYAAGNYAFSTKPTRRGYQLSGKTWQIDSCEVFPCRLIEEKDIWELIFTPSDDSSRWICAVDLSAGKIITPLFNGSMWKAANDQLLLETGGRYQLCDLNCSLTDVSIPHTGHVLAVDDQGYVLCQYPVPRTVRIDSGTMNDIFYQYTLLGPDFTVLQDGIDQYYNVGQYDYSYDSELFYNDLAAVRVGASDWYLPDGGPWPRLYFNSKYMFIDRSGKIVSNARYDEVSNENDRWFGCHGTTEYLLDSNGNEREQANYCYVPSTWAENIVEQAEKDGLRLSYHTPYRLNIHRDEFCKLAWQTIQTVNSNINLPEPAQPFSDCDEDIVRQIAALGIVTGYEDGTFQPTRELSRQEAAVILQRLYTVLYGKIEASPTLYADNGSIGAWAKDSVYAMRQTGIMQGVGANRFDPKNGYTCEQSIITMLRMTQKA